MAINDPVEVVMMHGPLDGKHTILRIPTPPKILFPTLGTLYDLIYQQDPDKEVEHRKLVYFRTHDFDFNACLIYQYDGYEN